MKKILYLSHRIPYPPNKGDKIRSFNEIKYLSKKYTVDLICLADEPQDIKYGKDLKRYCRRVAVFPLNTLSAKIRGLFKLVAGGSISQGYFYFRPFQDLYNQWVSQETYHALVCFSSPMAGYVFNAPQEIRSPGSLIMDFCDLDSDKWLQYSQKKIFPLSLLYQLEGMRLLGFEKKINRYFDQSVFVSKAEADLFKHYFSKARCLNVVPNGVDYKYFDPDLFCGGKKPDHPVVGFFGAMDYYANVDGALWFAHEVWPQIKKQIPGALFYIVGSKPDSKLKALASDPSIRITGFVDDIREYYHKMSVCVVPLRIARGVQNKLLEAMSMGRAIVTTSPAVQGIGALDKPFLSIEDEPDQFAGQVVKHLQNETGRTQAGNDARRYIKKNFNWDANMHQAFL